MSRPSLRLAARPDAPDGRDARSALSAEDRARLEQLFLDNLDAIEGVVRFVCRRHKVSAAETEEFSSEVKLRMVQSDYEVLRRFEGRSSLRTYLTVVIGRLYLDYCNHHWGKWRVSAEARRLGPVAIRLETLLVRDGLGFSEAARVLLHQECAGATEEELLAIAARLPVRMRRVMVGELTLETTPSDSQTDASALLADRRAAALSTAIALRAAMAGLTDQEQLILRLQYLEGLSIADIARALHLESKPLYRRLETVMKHLRSALLGAGVSEVEARALIDGTAADIGLALMWKPASSPDEDASPFTLADR